MHIKGLYGTGRPVVSFEVFPPKKDADAGSIYASLGRMSALSPDFISVTCGAGGDGNRNMTVEIASRICREHGIRSLAHMTCVGSDSEGIRRQLGEMRDRGIDNVLALRGDIVGDVRAGSYRYAGELIRDIRSRGGFCIGAACYPEGHIDCDDLELDAEYMYRKQEAGADFFISQLFFDNDYFFRSLDRVRAKGVTLPVSAGVMPILGRSQIERMIFLCGASLPSAIVKLLHKYEDSPDDLRKAGIEYAAAQLEDLLQGGVDGVHIYTMNQSDIAESCMKHIGRA